MSKDRYYIEDWSGFDSRRHVYLVVTGCLLPCWLAHYPINEFLLRKERREGNELLWSHWVKSISVYDGNSREVARFSLLKWEWRTLSRGTTPPLQKGK